MKKSEYVTLVGETEFVIDLQGPDSATINNQVRSVHLENIDSESLFSLLIGPRSYEVFVERDGDNFIVDLDGDRFQVQVSQGRKRPARKDPSPPAAGLAPVKSPLSGTVIEVLVAEGQTIQVGDVVATLEAMKMENAIRATREGIVKDIQVDTGQVVKTDEVILYIDSPDELQ